jgi:hypothetical protein
MSSPKPTLVLEVELSGAGSGWTAITATSAPQQAAAAGMGCVLAIVP